MHHVCMHVFVDVFTSRIDVSIYEGTVIHNVLIPSVHKTCRQSMLLDVFRGSLKPWPLYLAVVHVMS